MLHSLGRKISVSDEVYEFLRRYEWPGNIRELDNVLRSAAVLSGKDVIEAADLPPAFRKTSPSTEQIPQLMTLEAMEKEAIKTALTLTNNNRKEATKMLAISEATLYRKIKKYRL